VEAIARTAFAVAAVRAAESTRPDRLFHDPFAATFLAAADTTLAAPDFDAPDRQRRAVVRGIVIRTRFFDELLTDAATTCRQIVVLGAGLDARAFRLRWPAATRLYELDLPEVLEWKQHALDSVSARPTCQRVAVPADLRRDWVTALASAGHRSAEPKAWLAEGLLAYLEAAAVDDLLRAVSGLSALGARLGLTIRRASTVPPLTDLWVSHVPDDPVRWLDDHGWQATMHRRGELAASYGRHEWSDLSSQHLVDATLRRSPRPGV
jgi:methyltransferase (TIGR00027 family)